MEFGSLKFALWIATQGFRIIKDFSNLGARERGDVAIHINNITLYQQSLFRI